MERKAELDCVAPGGDGNGAEEDVGPQDIHRVAIDSGRDFLEAAELVTDEEKPFRRIVGRLENKPSVVPGDFADSGFGLGRWWGETHGPRAFRRWGFNDELAREVERWIYEHGPCGFVIGCFLPASEDGAVGNPVAQH